jgi:hypothetical protein
MIYAFRRLFVVLLLHNSEINFQSPKKPSNKNTTNKKDNYVVAEKLMLENVSLTKWNQLKLFVSRSNFDLFAYWN